MKDDPGAEGCSKIVWRDPAMLKPHATTRHLHRLADDDPRMVVLRRSIQRSGFAPDKPLTITEENDLVDGRHRHRAATILQIHRVPCVVIPEDRVATVIVESLIARKHFSKSAITFEIYPLYEDAHQEAMERHYKNLKKGPFSPSDAQRLTGDTVSSLAEELGISPTTFKLAAKVHKLFAAHPDYAEQMRPRLFGEFQGGEHECTRPVGLGAIISGFAGKANEDKTKREHEQLYLFGRAVKSFVFQAAHLDGDDAGARAQIRAHLEACTPEELERIATTAVMVSTEARRALKPSP